MGGGLITTYLCRRVFLQEIFSLSTVSRASSCCVWSEGFSLAWQPLSSCWSKTHLTADTVTFPPAASNPLQTCFLCFFFWVGSWPSWPVFSQQQVIVCVSFLIIAVTRSENMSRLYFMKAGLYGSVTSIILTIKCHKPVFAGLRVQGIWLGIFVRRNLADKVRGI